MEVFETNDATGRYFADRYIVFIGYEDDEEYEYFIQKEQAYEWIERCTGCKDEDEINSFNTAMRVMGDIFTFINTKSKTSHDKHRNGRSPFNYTHEQGGGG